MVEISNVINEGRSVYRLDDKDVIEDVLDASKWYVETVDDVVLLTVETECSVSCSFRVVNSGVVIRGSHIRETEEVVSKYPNKVKDRVKDSESKYPYVKAESLRELL